jgi:hypothetical protein
MYYYAVHWLNKFWSNLLLHIAVHISDHLANTLSGYRRFDSYSFRWFVNSKWINSCMDKISCGT